MRSSLGIIVQTTSKTRSDVYPKTLFKLVCGSCGAPLILGHSGEHPSVCCQNGPSGKNDCKYRGYKSVAIIERCVLEHLKSAIFTEDRMQALIKSANVHLQRIACQPKSDTTTLEATIKEWKSRLDKLLALTENGTIDIEAARSRIQKCERRLKKAVQI